MAKLESGTKKATLPMSASFALEAKRSKLPNHIEDGYGADGSVRRLVYDRERQDFLVVNNDNDEDPIMTFAYGILKSMDEIAVKKAKELGLTPEQHALVLGYHFFLGELARIARDQFDFERFTYDHNYQSIIRDLDD